MNKIIILIMLFSYRMTASDLVLINPPRKSYLNGVIAGTAGVAVYSLLGQIVPFTATVSQGILSATAGASAGVLYDLCTSRKYQAMALDNRVQYIAALKTQLQKEKEEIIKKDEQVILLKEKIDELHKQLEDLKPKTLESKINNILSLISRRKLSAC